MIPSNVHLIPADTANWKLLIEAQNQGFSDYSTVPFHPTACQLQELLEAWDVDLSGSVLALAEEERPVGIGWLGVRKARGWIGGFAVISEWQGQGVDQAILNWLIRAAQQRHLNFVTLEVSEENRPAISLYQASGFHVQRKLLSWKRSPEMGTLPVPPMKVERVNPQILVSYLNAWHFEPPCWQQEPRSLQARLKTCAGWVIACAGEPVAYALTSVHGQQLEIIDIGAAPDPEALLVLRALLQSLQLLHMDCTLTLNNIPANDPLNRVLAALGFQVILRLYEMRLDLSL